MVILSLALSVFNVKHEIKMIQYIANSKEMVVLIDFEMVMLIDFGFTFSYNDGYAAVAVLRCQGC